MQLNVHVYPEIWNWVLQQIDSGILPSKMRENLDKWINDEKEPTFNQLEQLSKVTGIPFGYFFLKTPPRENLSLVEYRTVDSVELTKPSRNLIDTMHDMEMVQGWMKDCLSDLQAEDLRFVGSLKNVSKENAPIVVRDILSLRIDWFKDVKTAVESFKLLRNIMSDLGVVIMMSGIVGSNTHRPLNTNEFRAFAKVDDHAPLIFINANDSTNGRLFSLIHEFTHICLGEDSLFNDRYGTNNIRTNEVICNYVAAEILVPEELFVKEWKKYSKERDVLKKINNIASEFKCGTTVVARRALDNEFITDKIYRQVADNAIQQYLEFRKNAKENSGGNYYNTALSRIDKRFFSMLQQSVYEGKTMYSDAFRLTNTNRKTFSELSLRGGAM